jgi:hypothetical protein
LALGAHFDDEWICDRRLVLVSMTSGAGFDDDYYDIITSLT